MTIRHAAGVASSVHACRRWLRVVGAVTAVTTIAAFAGSCRTVDAETTTALQTVLAATPIANVSPDVWKDVRAFYAQRENAPVWLVGRNAAKDAEVPMHLLQTATDHGLDPADYGVGDIERSLAALDDKRNTTDEKDAARAQRFAELDARVTAGVLALGRDVAIGHIKPQQLNPRWKAQRAVPDLPGTLSTAMDAGAVEGWLDAVRPRHPEYARLQQALRQLRSPSAAAPPPPAESDRQIAQIAANMERWRWLPDDLGQRHFLVNIPAYHLFAREDGKPVLEMRVVVGKPGHETPVFSKEMTTVVFSPYWNIPDSIVVGETAPAVMKDPNYVKKNNLEILRVTSSGTEIVNPNDVNWDDPAALKALAIRQRPGAANALGHVKFLFPNEFDVYLHDTPADALFEREGRAFSHGCVRVEEPEALAKYVLRDDPDWDEARILKAMNAGEERHVKLKAPIPVHIAYFTAWVDEAGVVQYLPDVYKLDSKQRSLVLQ